MRWTGLALLWYPLRFGNSEWELGVISSHSDGMPLGTIGLCALALGALGRGWRGAGRPVRCSCRCAARRLWGHLLDVRLALQGPAELGPAVKRVILKASVFAVTYVALHRWLGWYVWRKERPLKARHS